MVWKRKHEPVMALHPTTIGCDWDEEGCWWAAVGAQGNVLDTNEVTSTPEGLETLLGAVRRFADPATGELPAVVIENTRRPMFRALQDAGVEVLGISANNLWGQRAGRKKSKSDKNDSIKIARHYRADTTDFHPLPLRTPSGTALALLARQEKEAALRAQRDAGRVRSILAEFYPAPLGCWTVGKMAESVTAASVLLRAPSPKQGRALTLDEIEEIIRLTGKKSAIKKEAERAYEALGRTFIQYPPEVERHFTSLLIKALVALDYSVTAALSLEKELLELVVDHPYTTLITPAVGAGPKIIARIIAEMSDDPDRFPSLDELAAFAGTSPLDKSSHSRQDMERRDVKGNRLHRAMWDWAEVSRRYSPGAMAFYWTRRKEGDGHPTAIRKVAFKLTVRLHHCITTNTVWDETIAWPHAPSKEEALELRDEVKAMLAKKRRPGLTRPTLAIRRRAAKETRP